MLLLQAKCFPPRHAYRTLDLFLYGDPRKRAAQLIDIFGNHDEPEGRRVFHTRCGGGETRDINIDGGLDGLVTVGNVQSIRKRVAVNGGEDGTWLDGPHGIVCRRKSWKG